MSKILMIIEVSRKQRYIFSSKKLKENVARSSCIRYVTSKSFFNECQVNYEPVYSGGGHAVVQFDDEQTAMTFAKTVTEKARRDFDGLELFVKQIPYDASVSPKENLIKLLGELERKKSLRLSDVRQINFGIEKPTTPKSFSSDPRLKSLFPPPPTQYAYPVEFDHLAGNDNFIAVVHIDGNGMGKRVNQIYGQQETSQWDKCCELLNKFSNAIQNDYEEAFKALCQKLTKETDTNLLPIRPVVLAGDDICFVTRGNIGLACADLMIKELSKRINPIDNLPYFACAGVALVHKKYPFSQAYQLSEELCSNAKRFSANINKDKTVSSIDWHIEFGQLKGGLEEIRKDYLTFDGDLLTLRPVASVVSEGNTVDTARTFKYFKNLCLLMNNSGEVARRKLKEIRQALKQGEPESLFFLQDKQLIDLLYLGFTAMHSDEATKEVFNIRKTSQEDLPLMFFYKFENDDKKRCLFFDAIELMDRCCFFEEE